MFRAEIIGNLGQDAKVVRTNKGRDFVALSIAHSRKYTKSTGERVEDTTWVNVSINWNCEKILPYLLKGTKIFAAGSLSTRIYTARDGNNHIDISLMADVVELCGTSEIRQNENYNPIDINTGER